MKFRYEISKEAARSIFVETGDQISLTQEIDVDPAILTREDRAYLVEQLGFGQYDQSIELRLSGWGWGGIKRQDRFVAPAIIADASALLAAYRDAETVALAEAEAKRDEKAADVLVALRKLPATSRASSDYNELKGSPLYEQIITAKAEADRRFADWEAEMEVRERAQREEKERQRQAREADKVRWIAAHGSDYLRRAAAGGYNCQRKYALERAALEYPEYVVDFDDVAEWKARSCPSEAALDEAERVGGRVVWLTTPPNKEDYYEYPAREAVVVEDYLGAYDLVRVMP